MRTSLWLVQAISHVCAFTFSAAKLQMTDSALSFTHDETPSVSPQIESEWSFADTLKVSLTVKSSVSTDSQPIKPHQAMLLISNTQFPDRQVSLVLPVKPTGRATISFSQREINPALLQGDSIDLTLVLAGFQAEEPNVLQHVARLQIVSDPESPLFVSPMRYGPKDEIFHTFRQEQVMPLKAISLAFSAALIGNFVALIAAWFVIGANLSAMSDALKRSPIAYGLFLSTILCIEGLLGLYFAELRIFEVLSFLPVLAIVGFFSGRAALSEVMSRRISGQR